jgi:hypothetical protein
MSPRRSRRAGIAKLTNEYAGFLGNVYDRTPKAVFAALAVSFAMRSGLTGTASECLDEWRVLHENGIVPQKPLKA